MKNMIYVLIDPRDNQIRYVGKTEDGFNRWREHLHDAKFHKATHKINWINKLIKEGVLPIMHKVKCYPDNAILDSEEDFFITHFKNLGYNLVNSTNGGKGTSGYKHREDTKKVIGEKRKAAHDKNTIPWVPINRKEPKIIDGVPHKHCSDCDKYKLHDEYHNDTDKWDGKRSICIECANKRSKLYHQNNPSEKMTEEQTKNSYVLRSKNISKSNKIAMNRPEVKNKLSVKMSKPVIRIDPSTLEEKEYPSGLSTRDDGFSNKGVSDAIASGKLHRGYLWRKK